MDQTDQPILAWFMSGVLYWCAFAGASLGAVVVALETGNPGLPFPVFAVILIVGLAMAGWIGREKFIEEEVVTDHDEATDQSKSLYVGAGAFTAFLVTGGIVAAYVVA